jgi:hypothetical protein
LYGFIRVGLSTYQMQEVDPSEMDELLKAGDSMLWPLRFDRNKRIFPVPREGDWDVFFYDKPGVLR